MALKSMDELFIHELKDIYYAEKKLVGVTKKLAKESNSEEVSQAFLDHSRETEGQVKRLERVFKMLKRAPRGAVCHGVLGLIEEHKGMMEDEPAEELVDAINVGAGIKTERYEISAYEGLANMAHSLGMHEVEELLRLNLDEEVAALSKLQSFEGYYTRSAIFDEMLGKAESGGLI
jgi:ferritin-like metal-binding protein YciE